MKTISGQTFDGERALYGARDIAVRDCKFDGPADGESAFKECSNISAENCFFNLRYPFWHGTKLRINNSEMTELCRAALWYSSDIEIADTKLHGIKALRECSDVKMKNCHIISPEFGWSVKNIYSPITSKKNIKNQEKAKCTAKSRESETRKKLVILRLRTAQKFSIGFNSGE